MFKPDRPALLLLQADGRHDLERAGDWNSGDAGDPFPGSSARSELSDAGELSTSFAQSAASGISLRNIQRDAATGRVSFAVEIGGGATTATGTLSGRVEPRLMIPDADPRGISSSIALNGAGAVRELAVEVAIAHSYIGDLRVELFAPSGLSAVLHDRAGGSGDDIRRVFRSSEVPGLAALAGVPANGTWRLQVSDLVRADVGTLESWGISLVADTGSDVIRKSGSRAISIPDQDPAGIADTVSVAEAGVARAIALSVDISHSYVGDLRLELVSPAGETALLQDRSGGSVRDLKKTFSSADTAALGALVGAGIRGNWSLRVADLASRDTGTLDSWQLELRRAATPQTAQLETSPDLSIADAAPAGVGSALSFSNAGTVQSLTLKAHIEHPYIGDLRVELVAPSGVRATLWDQTGGRTRDLSLDLSSSGSQALSALSGQPLTGAWILRVADLAGQDTGTLKFWSLGVTYA
jgi:subtilisin-like proprotein convertase family protein